MKLDDLRFTQSHEWIAADGTVGISDHAQHEITDVVFVELPKAGRSVKPEEAICVVESVKAAFDIYAPVAGEVVAVNDRVVQDPAIVNKSSYDEGWLFRLSLLNPSDRDQLMTYTQYQEFVKSGH
jgi:glycine cleavage system H protein